METGQVQSTECPGSARLLCRSRPYRVHQADELLVGLSEPKPLGYAMYNIIMHYSYSA